MGDMTATVEEFRLVGRQGGMGQSENRRSLRLFGVGGQVSGVPGIFKYSPGLLWAAVAVLTASWRRRGGQKLRLCLVCRK